jgi:hypothetical protein
MPAGRQPARRGECISALLVSFNWSFPGLRGFKRGATTTGRREEQRERERAREGGREGGIRAAKDANPPVELLTTAGGNLCAAVSIFENRESPIIIPLI